MGKKLFHPIYGRFRFLSAHNFSKNRVKFIELKQNVYVLNKVKVIYNVIEKLR